MYCFGVYQYSMNTILLVSTIKDVINMYCIHPNTNLAKTGLA